MDKMQIKNHADKLAYSDIFIIQSILKLNLSFLKINGLNLQNKLELKLQQAQK